MNQAEAHGGAGIIKAMVTNEAKVHPAVKWARVTTDGIVTVKPDASPDRAQRGTILRKAVCQVLFETFNEITSRSSFEDVGALTDQAMRRIGDCFAGTDWEAAFEHPANKGPIAAYVHKNLLTAADLALKAE